VGIKKKTGILCSSPEPTLFKKTKNNWDKARKGGYQWVAGGREAEKNHESSLGRRDGKRDLCTISRYGEFTIGGGFGVGDPGERCGAKLTVQSTSALKNETIPPH